MIVVCSCLGVESPRDFAGDGGSVRVLRAAVAVGAFGDRHGPATTRRAPSTCNCSAIGKGFANLTQASRASFVPLLFAPITCDLLPTERVCGPADSQAYSSNLNVAGSL